MIVRHNYVFVGNMVSTKGIEGHVYDCPWCGKTVRTKDMYTLADMSRTFKVPGCTQSRKLH